MDIEESIQNTENALIVTQNKLSYINALSSINKINKRKSQKIRILTYLKQLKLIPLINSNSKSISSSLANTDLKSQFLNLSNPLSCDLISNQLFIQSNLSNLFNNLLDNLNNNINFNFNNIKKISNDEKLNLFLLKINNLKLNSRNLSSYIKILINDYLFNKEFSYLFSDFDHDSLKSRKQKFLKLLETLLNNNILNQNSSNPIWLTLSSIDDPLIRFLILNRLIKVHPTIPNKIRLNDLSVDL